MSSKRVAVIVLARAGSSRLPGKMMESFGGGSVLNYALQRCLALECADQVILATTTCSADDALAREAQALGLRVVRGSENDVVERMLQAVDALDEPCDVVVRACADNPLFMPSLVDAAVQELVLSGCDMVTPFEYATLPFGYGLVVMSLECLQRIDTGARHASYREHVENYCLEHPDQFNVRYQVAPPALAWPELCLTLDFDVDLVRLRLMRAVLDGVPLPTQPQALINHLQNLRVWIEGRDAGQPDGYDLVLLATARPGVQAPGGVLVVERFALGDDLRYGLRYATPQPAGFPTGPVYLEEACAARETPLAFLERNAELALPLLLAAPARTIDISEFAAPPIEKRVHGGRRRGFRNAQEESFPAQVVLDHAEHSPELLEALLNELETRTATDLFLPHSSPAEWAQAIARLGTERVHDECPAADPFRVLNVLGEGRLEIEGASQALLENSMASFWRSSAARSARAKVLNQEAG